MKLQKWLCTAVLSLFIVTTGLSSFCLAQPEEEEEPIQARTLNLDNGMVLQSVNQRGKQVWHTVGRNGKRSVANGTFKLQNGKMLNISKGVIQRTGIGTKSATPITLP